MDRVIGFIISMVFLIVCCGSFAAWVNHIVICFTDDRWGFLIAGALFFPVAVIHGAGAWFGAW